METAQRILSVDVQRPRIYLHADAGDAFRIVSDLSFEHVRALLAGDPLGLVWIVEHEGADDFKAEARWFLYDLMLARPALLREAVEVEGDTRRQLPLL